MGTGYFKPISISLSPNTEKDDNLLVLKTIFSFGKWKKGKAVKDLESEFCNYFNIKYAISFNSGRSSLFAILKSLNLEENDEILLQAFTCNAVVNPILWAGLKPIYVDCNEDDFNINTNEIEKKITKKTKALIIQHTFGIPADISKILEICKKNHLILIEDCAHSLGAEYKEEKVGTFGDVSFFSFSRDKIISSIYGGMVITNNKNLARKIKKFQEEINYPSCFWIFQQLLHPLILNYIILPVYNFLDLGKILLVFLQISHILSKAIHKKEKKGEKPCYFPKKMPNALSILALHQFKKLEKFNNHRKEIADFYYRNINDKFEKPKIFPERKSVFLRYTLKHKEAYNIIWQAWHKENILLGDWYTSVIAPYDTDISKMKYVLGSCPVAENLSKITFNLPTHINISLKEAQRIVDFLNNF